MSELSTRVRAASPGGAGILGNYLNGVNSYSFSENIQIQRSQIGSYVGITRTYGLSTGAARLLRRGRGIFRGRAPRACAHVAQRIHYHARAQPRSHNVFAAARPAVAASAPRHVGNSFFARLHRGVPAVDPYGGRTISFSPFQDLNSLKFGSKLHKIHMDHQLNVPGVSYYKLVATIAEVHNGVINYNVGYGWSYGMGKQLTMVTTVRKCKKKWFRKKCWNENLNIPRGVYPAELEAVNKGLADVIFSSVANRLSGRLLRMRRRKTNSPIGPMKKPSDNADIFQTLEGVKVEDLYEALKSLVGENEALTKEDVLAKKTIKFYDANGVGHFIKIRRGLNGTKNITVWSIRSE